MKKSKEGVEDEVEIDDRRTLGRLLLDFILFLLFFIFIGGFRALGKGEARLVGAAIVEDRLSFLLVADRFGARFALLSPRTRAAFTRKYLWCWNNIAR